MAYDYDTDILATLWTGGEDAEEPYASFIAANPEITDEVSENRILSTLELLRSHMELLQTREEAKLLHESISKLFRHSAGGSNPWSDTAAITEAVGNVKNPVFPAGASVDIIINGVTTAGTSATGGDCQTVVGELNATLGATSVQAVCVQPGNRLGFRASDDFVSFEISNGAGGIIGPGGVIPGTRLSAPARVADQGRNLSLNHFAGTPRNPVLTP